MSEPNCQKCGATVRPGARFCRSCGAPLARHTALLPVAEIALPYTRDVRIEGDQLSVRDLLALTDAGLRWWQQGLSDEDGLTRQHAARAIEELSRTMASLSRQLAAGTETMRITTRLPPLADTDLACPSCGSGNRPGARFCLRCGVTLSQPAPPPTVFLQSDIGKRRTVNQDVVASAPLTMPQASAQICLVADGMGGAAAGDAAARMATDVIGVALAAAVRTTIPADDAAWHTVLRDAVQLANRSVYDAAQSDPARRGMGTTLTLAVLFGGRLHLASVGDSRAYLLSPAGVAGGARIAQLTVDHTLVARLVDIGQLTAAQARDHPQRSVLYRAIGTDPNVGVDTRSLALRLDDLLLICSDGVTSHLADDELALLALGMPHETFCAKVVALANARGGTDNISVLLARSEGRS